jgi:hypothetical protein
MERVRVYFPMLCVIVPAAVLLLARESRPIIT